MNQRVVCLLSVGRCGSEVEILVQIPLMVISLSRQLRRVLQALLLFCRCGGGRSGRRGLEFVLPIG